MGFLMNSSGIHRRMFSRSGCERQQGGTAAEANTTMVLYSYGQIAYPYALEYMEGVFSEGQPWYKMPIAS